MGKVVDMDGVTVAEGTVSPKPIVAGEGTQVVEKPIAVGDTVGAPKRSEAEDVLAQALGAKKPEESVNAESLTETGGEDGDKKFVIDEMVARTLSAPDLHINQFFLGKRDLQYISDKLHEMYPTEAKQKEASENPLSMFNLLLQSFRDGWGTNQLMSYIGVIANKVKGETNRPCDHLTHAAEAGIKDGFTTSVNKSGKVDLTGEEARNAFMASISGLLKVKLPNSGFWVTVRRPLIHELQDIFEAADLEMRETGYSIGPHFALVADVYIKRRFLDSLIKYRIIRDSNLEGIFKDDTFFKALAFHDYDVLMHAVLSLMTRSKGIRARVVCPECNHATLLEKIDIQSAKFFNRELVTPAMHDWFIRKVDENGKPIGKLSLKDLEHYRKDILGFSYSFTEQFEDTNIRINLREPTMDVYFDIGDRICSQIQETIDESGTDDKQRRQLILANLAAHSYHMLGPWVDSLEQLDPTGNVTMRTSDIPTILDMFDITTQEASMKPLDELEKFLSMSKIAYIGLFALECPHCHAKPDVGANQFYPLELQTIFFGQLFRQLPAELMPQES